MNAENRLSRAVLVALTACLLAAPAGWSQPASLVADLGVGPDQAEGSSPRQLTAVRGGTVIFTADVPTSGSEVWRTDGTETGTRMLVDFDPGAGSSYPEILGLVGPARDVALWTASRAGDADEIWRTDGTEDGTFPLTDGGEPVTVDRLADINAGDGRFLPLDRAFVSGSMIFQGCGASQGCGLWRTDGTQEGTVLIQKLSRIGGPIVQAGSKIFFVSTATGKPMLWETQGTAATTSLLRIFSHPVRGLTAAGSKVFFTAPTSNGEELWVSDGTKGGTRSVTRMNPRAPFTPNADTAPALHGENGWVDFVADDGVHGWEIWRSNGTTDGTVRITNLVNRQPFEFATIASELLEVRGRVLFQVRNGGSTGGWSLWTTNGDPASTMRLLSCLGGCQTDHPGRGLLAVIAGRALFRAGDAASGTEVWSTDGTPSGTRRLGDFCPGPCSSQIAMTGSFRGLQVFVAVPDNHNPAQIWLTDGSVAGTQAITRFGPGTSAGAALPLDVGDSTYLSVIDADGEEPWVVIGNSERQIADLAADAPSSYPSGLTPQGDRLLFQPYLSAGTELWQTSGPGDTSRLVAPLLSPGIFCFLKCTQDIVSAGSWTTFLHNGNQTGTQVWGTDGTTGGTRQLTNLAPPARVEPDLAALGNGTVLFFVQRSGTRELWRSDGTPAGTQAVAALPGPTGPAVAGFTALGVEAWFATPESDGSTAVWRSNGTPEGTVRVLTLPDKLALQDIHFVRAGGRVFFASRQTSGLQLTHLWASDGTAAGTSPLTAEDAHLIIGEIRDLGNAAVFLALDQDAQTDNLWISDGTPAGTRRVRVFPLQDGSRFAPMRPHSLTPFDGRLFFAAWDPEHGFEPWSTDGTEAGTVLVKDIHPAGSSYPEGFTIAGDRLFFSAADSAHGVELWQTDGTEAGTEMVQDIAPGLLSAYPSQLTVVNGRLYFAADDGTTGLELWFLPLP
jgi:ELWxxDGT repeat protein